MLVNRTKPPPNGEASFFAIMSGMSTNGIRRPRFRRATTALQPMKITPRDLEILRQIAVHRFLRSSHITALVDGSTQQVLRRLQLLFHHGYLERPVAQIDYYYQRGGSREMVYGLASRGAGRLRRDLDMPFTRMDWSGKNQRAGRLFLEHAVMVSDIMVALELACRKSSQARLLSDADIALPASARKSSDPFHWYVKLSTRHRLGVVPDRVFGLEHADLPEGRNRAWFFLEADRGTMPVTRQNLDQSSYFRKMLAYEATWTQSIHRTRLGLNRFRVLTITSSREREKHLADACSQLERGQGLFLFAAFEDFLKEGKPLSAGLRTGRTEEVSFLSAHRGERNASGRER
jgi:Replication-relaxation